MSINYRIQTWLLVVFFLINFTLFFYSVDSKPYPGGPTLSATYHNAADGQRYWSVAINLAKKGTFTIPKLWDSRPESPLTRSGPLPALFFAIPIKLVGFDKAPVLIIFFQCILLYAMSLLVRRLAIPFSVNTNVVQSLVLFNPNLIGLAHHAQSDLLFSFIFTTLLFFVNKLLLYPTRSKLIWFTLFGILAGLLTLTRHVGLMLSLTMPIVVLISLAFHKDRRNISPRTIGIGLISSVFVFFLVISPWCVRNYVVFNNFSPITNHISQLEYNLSKLITYNHRDTQRSANELIATMIDNKLSLAGYSHSNCRSHQSEWSSCGNALEQAYISTIFSQPWSIILKASASASARTLLTGGSSRLSSYLGYADENFSELLNSSWRQDTSLTQLAKYLVVKAPFGYLVLFIFAFGFALITRIFGLFGMYTTLLKPAIRPFHIFYLLTIIIFLGAYFVASTSRFRAPMEPILMLYATIGLMPLLRSLGHLFSSKRLSKS